MTEDANRFDPEAYDSSQGFVAEYGRDLLDLLAAEPGERVLDLGCGTGHVTAEIAEATGERGAVVGIDASPAMVERAREAHPGLDVRVADATAFEADEPFDAVYSNAALHWIEDQDAALERVAAALSPGGRFVAEMGARGNVAAILEAVEAEGARRGVDVEVPWHFPTLGAYAARLERHGFEVRLARTFERETRLDGADGLRAWLAQFGDELLAPFSDADDVTEAVEERLRPECYDASAGAWTVGYRRLQFRAVRGPDG